jgi:hypothetical protein
MARYWWVNHKQTFRQEIGGGYIWSPKRNSNGSRNQTYENLRQVVPGDVIFSYANGEIRYFGVASRPAASCPKPITFGDTGANWDRDGWMVPIKWREVTSLLQPKAFIDELRLHLPERYSPLRAETGDGNQNVYLAAVPDGMAAVLLAHLGPGAAEVDQLADEVGDDDGAVRTLDDDLEKAIAADSSLDGTAREALIAARRGQGRFRLNVEAIERGCRLTGVTDRRLLRASHIKPWRSCITNEERLDGENGLLLTPTADHLFDRGYISFSDDGSVLVSPVIDAADLSRLGLLSVHQLKVDSFSPGQRTYLAFHRADVFLEWE